MPILCLWTTVIFKRFWKSYKAPFKQFQRRLTHFLEVSVAASRDIALEYFKPTLKASQNALERFLKNALKVLRHSNDEAETESVDGDTRLPDIKGIREKLRENVSHREKPFMY